MKYAYISLPLIALVIGGCTAPSTPEPNNELLQCQKTSLSKMVLTQKSYTSLQTLNNDLKENSLTLDTINDFLKWFGGSLGEYTKYLEASQALLSAAKLAGVPYASDFATYNGVIKRQITLTTQTSELISRFTLTSTAVRNQFATISSDDVTKLRQLAHHIDMYVLPDMMAIKQKTTLLLEAVSTMELTLTKLTTLSNGADKVLSSMKEWVGLPKEETSYMTKLLSELKAKSTQSVAKINQFHARLERDIALAKRVETYFELIDEIEKRP